MRAAVVGGETLTVSPLTVGQLPRFARTVRPLAPQLAGEETDWLGLVAEHGEALIEAAAVATDTERQPAWIRSLALDEFVMLLSAIFEVSVDFFVCRLVPVFSDASDRIVKAIAGVGPTPSKP